jgi:hypothetical protein
VPRPTAATDQAGAIEFVVAVKAYDQGEVDTEAGTERYRWMSYDLDGKCTGQGEGFSCIKPSWAITEGSDGPQGRDNAIGALLYRVADGGTRTSESATSSIERGTITTVIRVRGYNGTSVDPDVEVAAFGASMNRGAPERGIRPKWLGEDEWEASGQWVERDSTGALSVEHPKSIDRKAYVNNWILVANFDRYQAPVYHFTQLKLSARILFEDERWHLLEGMTGGRTKTDEILWSVEWTTDPETGDRLCTDAPTYANTKRAICSTMDISSTGPDDGTMPCDASSWGWRFEALPARLTGAFEAEFPRICPPETSPWDDSCSTLGATQ